MSTRTRSFLTCGIAALSLALAPASRDPVQAASGFEVALSGARVDMIEKDRIVASFDATGDIRGLFTATIDRDEKGALSGEWVLVSQYLRDLTPEGEVDERANDERAALPGEELHRRHKEYIGIHNRGTVHGSITGGSLSFDVDGRLRTIESLQVSIDGGNLEFRGMAGAGSLTRLQPPERERDRDPAPDDPGGDDGRGEVMTTLRLRHAFAAALAVCLLGLGATDAHATHFRYGTIRWERVSEDATNVTIRVTHESAWRLNFGWPSTADVGVPLNIPAGSGALTVQSTAGGGVNITRTMTVVPSFINTAENWFVGSRQEHLHVPEVRPPGARLLAGRRAPQRDPGRQRGYPVPRRSHHDGGPERGVAGGQHPAHHHRGVPVHGGKFFIPAGDVEGDPLTWSISPTAALAADQARSRRSAEHLPALSRSTLLPAKSPGTPPWRTCRQPVAVSTPSSSWSATTRAGRHPSTRCCGSSRPSPTRPSRTSMTRRTSTRGRQTDNLVEFVFKGIDNDPGAQIVLTSGNMPPGATMTPSLPTAGSSPRESQLQLDPDAGPGREQLHGSLRGNGRVRQPGHQLRRHHRPREFRAVGDLPRRDDRGGDRPERRRQRHPRGHGQRSRPRHAHHQVVRGRRPRRDGHRLRSRNHRRQPHPVVHLPPLPACDPGRSHRRSGDPRVRLHGQGGRHHASGPRPARRHHRGSHRPQRRDRDLRGHRDRHRGPEPGRDVLAVVGQHVPSRRHPRYVHGRGCQRQRESARNLPCDRPGHAAAGPQPAGDDHRRSHGSQRHYR